MKTHLRSIFLSLLAATLLLAALPEGVTVLRDRTFADCSRLTRVRLPDGLTQLSENAFTFALPTRPAPVFFCGENAVVRAYAERSGSHVCEPARFDDPDADAENLVTFDNIQT